MYADSQTPVSADGFHFTGSAGLPAFERGFQALESLSCDILVTPHPSASAFWERVEGTEPLINQESCRQYAEAGRARLAQRLEEESRTGSPAESPMP